MSSALMLITVDGSDITSALSPVLISATVCLQAEGGADTADLVIDDTGGQIVMPPPGVKMMISLGWQGEGLRQVFEGTVDEIRSTGSRSGGRTMTLTAKGFDASGKVKEGQRRHWDDATVQTILGDAGKAAGVTSVSVDPSLASVVVDYFAMIDESFLHAGRRLAQIVGGQFRIQGAAAIMSKVAGDYTPTITAAWGSNLHSWDVTPSMARRKFGKVRAPWYDKAAAKWEAVEVSTGIKSDAVDVLKPCSTQADAKRKATAAAKKSKRDSGIGTVAIEGNTGAAPDVLCTVAGTRPGVDGSYRIGTTTHSFSRGSGFVTSLDLVEPQGDAATT